MSDTIKLTCFSDVLCIWAHIGQIRADEAESQFGDHVSVDYRFCSVFGDTAHKIGEGWAKRGSYEGFGEHVHQSVSPYPHISVHPAIWKSVRPASSTPAHLVLKAIQCIDAGKTELVLKKFRIAFFEECLDIATWKVLSNIIHDCDLPLDDIRDCLNSGEAHADLEADQRDRVALMVQGSPTWILNEGRQKLYGNVGYRVLEANIKELLASPASGAASWC